MKVLYGTLFMTGIAMIMSQEGCKNNTIVNTSNPVVATISGVVYGSSYSSTATPLAGAAVRLSYGSTSNSITTDSSGAFSFNVEVSDTSKGVDVTLNVSAAGYIPYNYTFKVKSSPGAFTITLALNTAEFAILTGAVLDSTNRYPLGNAVVTVSLPGGTISTATLQNGYYSLSVNLYSLSSLASAITVTKNGFKTFRQSLTLRKATTVVDTVFLPVDLGSTIAHVAGIVTDSRTGQPIPSVTVLLASSLGNDSTKTLGDGSYRFDPNLNGQPSVPMTLTFRQNGYNASTANISLSAGQSLTENVVLTSNWNYAAITGTVRDSATSLPLSGAKVIVSLTGTTGSTSKFMAGIKSHSRSVSSIILDSTTTFVDGSFSLAINLVDLDSISATLTVSEPGYKVLQFVRTFSDVPGANNLGNVYIKIDNGLTTAHVMGYVTDSQSRLPISGVSVTLTTPIKVDSTKASYGGFYSFDLNLQGLSSVSGLLLFRLNSYDDTTISFSVVAGQTLTQNAILSAKPVVVVDTAIVGIAKTFKLVSVEKSEIAITGASTGASKGESSTIVWQVLDSLGNPVGNGHQYKVAFSLSETPNGLGGATIIPDTAVTDGSGKIYATIVSGTTAGVIQVTAKLQLASGMIIQATPVPITVDAGLPDQTHFMLNSNPPHGLNFAGYDWSEVTQGFTAQVGDKFGNPVAPSTAIYFNSTACVVTAAAQTDVTGHGNATLYSGNPLPVLPPSLLSSYTGLAAAYFGDGTGYAFVKAWTQGESNVSIADSDLICISGKLDLSKFTIEIDSTLSPPSAWGGVVHSGSYIVYHVHISDEFGNPLEAGTNIKATTILPPPPPGGGGIVWSILPAGLGLIVQGSNTTSLELGDYLVRGTGSTDFYVTVSATLTQGSPPQTTAYALSIDVQGRNTGGNVAEMTINGIATAP